MFREENEEELTELFLLFQERVEEIQIEDGGVIYYLNLPEHHLECAVALAPPPKECDEATFMGGTRVAAYESRLSLVTEAKRLANGGMSPKARVAGLMTVGGAKGVVNKKPFEENSGANTAFRAYGHFILFLFKNLGKRFVTSWDAGMQDQWLHIMERVADGHIVRQNTAEPTAEGIVLAVDAFARASGLEDRSVAVMGVGNVGKQVIRLLHRERNWKIFIADENPDQFQVFQTDAFHYGEHLFVKGLEEIVAAAPVLVLCVSAGGFITRELIENTLRDSKVKAIISATNGPLAKPEHARLLLDMEIFYGVDYVVNAGGLLSAAYNSGILTYDEYQTKLHNISVMTQEMYRRSRKSSIPTTQIAHEFETRNSM